MNGKYKRTFAQIKKKVIDIKSDVRKKSRNIKRYRETTGGGGPCGKTLEEFENIMLGSIDPVMISGIKGGIDSGVNSEDNNDSDINDDSNSATIISVDDTLKRNNNELEMLVNFSQKKLKTKALESIDVLSSPSIASSPTSTSMPKIKVKTTTPHDEIIKIEKNKLELKKYGLKLKFIKLAMKTKEFESNGCDITVETIALQELHNEFLKNFP
jgi:hypothetical protein